MGGVILREINGVKIRQAPSAGTPRLWRPAPRLRGPFKYWSGPMTRSKWEAPVPRELVLIAGGHTAQKPPPPGRPCPFSNRPAPFEPRKDLIFGVLADGAGVEKNDVGSRLGPPSWRNVSRARGSPHGPIPGPWICTRWFPRKTFFNGAGQRQSVPRDSLKRIQTAPFSPLSSRSSPSTAKQINFVLNSNFCVLRVLGGSNPYFGFTSKEADF